MIPNQKPLHSMTNGKRFYLPRWFCNAAQRLRNSKPILSFPGCFAYTLVSPDIRLFVISTEYSLCVKLSRSQYVLHPKFKIKPRHTIFGLKTTHSAKQSFFSSVKNTLCLSLFMASFSRIHIRNKPIKTGKAANITAKLCCIKNGPSIRFRTGHWCETSFQWMTKFRQRY